jgi:hypothetical protein
LAATGNDNTADGFNALSTNTTGFRDTAIGGNALIDDNTGTQHRMAVLEGRLEQVEVKSGDSLTLAALKETAR